YPLHDYCTKEQWEILCRAVQETDHD
ncbi:hypothetical protein LCGC14_2601780, partial [marine sediment metagenome]